MKAVRWQIIVAAVVVSVVSCGLVGVVRGGEDCTVVEIADKQGSRLAKAEIVVSYHKYRNFVFQTNRSGQVCISNYGRATLIITPPQLSGDSCLYTEGGERFDLDPAAGKRQRFQVERRTLSMPRSHLRGRILSPSGQPVSGARVLVYHFVVKTKDSVCSLGGEDEAYSTKDGSFSLPAIPHGLIELLIQRKGFAQKLFSVRTPVPSVSVVLDHGAAFNGRVLDPDGVVIERCEVWLKTDPYALHHAECTSNGFSLKNLPPGEAKLEIHLREGSGLGIRQLIRKVRIQPSEQRQEDVRWPAGEAIAGQVVTAAGDPVAGVWIRALPRGISSLPTETHPDEVRVKSDALGHFAFGHISPGTWVLDSFGTEAPQEATTGDAGVRLVKQMN